VDKQTRNAIDRATQRARRLLEDDFAEQLEADFDMLRSGEVAPQPSPHLTPHQVYQRGKIVAVLEHKLATGMTTATAVADYIRDAAFTTLNRFVALEMLEARELVQECVSRGEESAGYREFCGMAPGLPLLPAGAGYRLYIESLFDELSTEVKVLFDRRDPVSVLWPRRATFEGLLTILNAQDLAGIWAEDETIGWFYQYFNSDDERRKMREESQAPRNSRELAIRNQFFTPRYVVQFLTDNTLGRIWYEMRGTDTALANQCGYLVRKPGEKFAPRQKKDPRDIRALDPACGSGHFLLHAFDLLITIYEEAYADPESPTSEATGRTLAEDYPTLEALRKAIPGLVLAQNLHGVDIDPRCAQIAQLALWMRAQRAYRDFGIGRAVRPQIRRSNIVIAEPLITDDQAAASFIAKLNDKELAQIFSDLVDALSLAGDLGLLLRAESGGSRPLAPGYERDLLTPAEDRLQEALTRFAVDERLSASATRRLFAEDAVNGMGFMSVARRKFDVVLTNPPFGESTDAANDFLKRFYPTSHGDLATCFIEAGCLLLHTNGLLGTITTRTIFLLAQSSKFRSTVLDGGRRMRIVADLGYGVLDGATVETAAYVVSATSVDEGTWIRLVKEADKAELLRNPPTELTYRVRPRIFQYFPKVPFSYWVPAGILQAFARLPAFEGKDRWVRCGMGTLDDFRFVRCWWEVSSSRLHEQSDHVDVSRPWVTYAKAGEASPFVIDMPQVVNFGQNGREVKVFVGDRVGSPSRKIQSERFYRRPGIQFGRRVRLFSPAALPAQVIFSDSANAVFFDQDKESTLYRYLALLNGRVSRALFSAFAPARKMEVGYLQRMPVPRLGGDDAVLSDLGREGATEALRRLSIREASRYFTGFHEVQLESQSENDDSFSSKLDRAAADSFEVSDGDIRVLEEASETQLARSFLNDDSIEDDKKHRLSGAQALKLSWLVGVAFGRFDPRLSTGERPATITLSPFDPFPSRSPGMWPEGESGTAGRADVIVDDEGHPEDIMARIHAAATEARLEEVEHARTWLSKGFFSFHLKMYSKGGRKAPIYWQLSTPSAKYSVWLYIHALTRDTMYRVQNDYVVPKLMLEERRLETMRQELQDRSTAAERRELTDQETFVDELRGFLDEVKRVAPLWHPDLDDGVIINFAPLWRLVHHHRPWQKELKTTWDALCAGKYDWAHLAMHLWPERVVPNCATDRSLAIAHDLEDVFWEQITDGKWSARSTPTRPVDELIQERTSPAIKDALRGLLSAPTAASGGGTRRRRSAADQGNSGGR
jgi:hypothetical protein